MVSGEQNTECHSGVLIGLDPHDSWLSVADKIVMTLVTIATWHHPT